MERGFFKINDSYDALKVIASSPEEGQQHDKVHPDSSEWPPGMFLDVVKRVEANRTVHYFGMAKIGERYQPPAEKDKPMPQAPVKRAVPLPKVVENASEATIDTMAQRNGIDTDSMLWKKRPLVAKRADVAEAMRKINAA